MKKLMPFISGAIFGLLMLFLFTNLVSANKLSGFGPSSDGQPTPPPSFEDEIYPPDPITQVANTAESSTPVTVVYFAPTDNNATSTYINLYNTSAMTQTVNLQAFNSNGVLYVDVDISVGVSKVVRVISDGLAASPPSSWANYVYANFTDFSTIAVLKLPPDVKAEVYMVYNPGTGTIDPRADQGAVPIRLSSDPFSIHLPSIQQP